MAQSKAYDANAGQWPAFSGFEALTPKSAEIRVLKLEKASETNILHYSMRRIDVRALRTSSFSALSYSWGAPVPTASQKQIVIGGKSVHIRPTLHSFLKTLAVYNSEVSLWIDAICINQSDVKERKQQISMMAEIFATAEKVYVWLGQGDDDTNYALAHIIDDSPGTAFDQQQFRPCIEKLFRSSYWTRRWVIQEFALARELYIACGPHMTTWSKILEKVDGTTVGDDKHALQTFENFKRVKVLGSTEHLNLIELMLRFKDARCIDARDRVFALKGIATDGQLLSPDYGESVSDVFFRILAQLPTEKVLPPATGYRWPHDAVLKISQCLPRGILLHSLSDKERDVLFATFEYIGIVSTAFDVQDARFGHKALQHIQLLGTEQYTLYGSIGISPGDLVYSLQSSPRSPKGLLVAFKSSLENTAPTGILLDNAYWLKRGNFHYNLRAGIELCSRNIANKSRNKRVLCHVSRWVFALLWLLDTTRMLPPGLESSINGVGPSASELHLCRCAERDMASPNGITGPQPDTDGYLELLPIFEQDTRDYSIHSAWTSLPPAMVDKAQQISLKSCDSHKLQPDFKAHRRTDLSYAAEEGHEAWIDHLLSSSQPDNDSPDEIGRTPLSWAITGQHVEAIQKLLLSGNVNPTIEDKDWRAPLRWAIDSGYRRGIELLLNEGNVDPSIRERGGRTYLSWAAQGGNPEVVEALLASSKIIPDAEDADGMTALTWAAKIGHEKVVELLLATKRVDYNKKDLTGRTPLSWAAQHGSAAMTKLLLAQEKIEPDLKDHERYSPLRRAAQYRKSTVFKLLLATGKVDFNFKYDYTQDDDASS